jgi:OOP family OmpA-OmpF porin
MPSSLLVRLTVAALLLGMFGLPAGAEDQKYELGILGGAIYLDESLAGSTGPTIEPTVGIRAGGPLPFGSFGWFADALYADIDTETFRLGAQSLTARGGLEWLHPGMYSKPLFVTFGLGYNNISFDEATDYSSMFVSAGVGQKYRLGGNKQFLWELRADHSLADEGLAGEDIAQPMLLVGLSWEFGRGKRREAPVRPESVTAEPEPAEGTVVAPVEQLPDADSDGVPDTDDRCPATLLGIEVAEDGCPRDDDGDGVHDGLGMDRCPGTPRGAVVDSHGCPLDSDGDGVYDGLDRCPESDPGSSVDADGC